jgi:pSer/pThr/pTyr-binding forkhead associated (FHA) protein
VPESVLTILKFCFLALIYLFLYRVVRVVIAEMRAPAPAPSPPGARPAAQPAPPRANRGRGPARLRILEPAERRGETFTLDDELTVGRGGGCGVVLDDTFVSQVHARVFRRDGDVYVEDLGSRNGTLLNGNPLDGTERVRRGDRIQFGRTVTEVMR